MLKQLMNNRGSLEELLTRQELLNSISLCALSHYSAVKKLVYELLAAIVLLRPEEGHPVVLAALDYFRRPTKSPSDSCSIRPAASSTTTTTRRCSATNGRSKRQSHILGNMTRE